MGHTALAITGRGVYSFGNGREMATDSKGNIMGGNTAAYIYRESKNRSTYLAVIRTTPEQDARIDEALRSIAKNEPALQEQTSILWDNCSSRSNRGLDAGGIPRPNDTMDALGGTIEIIQVPGTAGFRAADPWGINIPKNPSSLPLKIQQFQPTP